MENKRNLAEEKVFLARMVSDLSLYTAEEVHENGYDSEEFITQDNKYALKYVAPYERKGRRDKGSDGSDKPKVKVRPFFRKKISLNDHRELYGINSHLITLEHKLHTIDSEWHNLWKERVKGFCEIERRFYPNGEKSKDGYKIADAYYKEKNTVLEFQKSFDDEVLNKTTFYKKENLDLIWLFYLPTLSVFKDDNVYKIREDNYYHFFRIDQIIPDFFSNNIVFIHDKNNKIYRVEELHRVESSSELEATVRYFKMSLSFESPEVYIEWFRNEWKNKEQNHLHRKGISLNSLSEILPLFEGTDETRMYLQNCAKNDINGMPLIYLFVNDGHGFRKTSHGYKSFRCYIEDNGYYRTFKNVDETIHGFTERKWLLLATNKRRYHKKINL